MLISDAEALLGITIQGDATLEARFEAAKDFGKEHCRNDFLVEQDDGTYKEVVPKGAQMGIALIIRAMGEQHNVQNKSLGGLGSKGFFEGATGREAKKYLKPYVKVYI